MGRRAGQVLGPWQAPENVTDIAGCGPVFGIARQDPEDPDWTGVWPSAILYNRFLRTTGSGGRRVKLGLGWCRRGLQRALAILHEIVPDLLDAAEKTGWHGLIGDSGDIVVPGHDFTQDHCHVLFHFLVAEG